MDKKTAVLSQETYNKIMNFRDERNWKQFHNPKDLAISISIEASELLEIFQWSGSDVSSKNKGKKIKEELADVLMYTLMMADVCDLDIEKILNEKLEINSKKYPIEKAYGTSVKYTDL